MTMPRIPDTRRSYLRVRDVDLYCEDTGGEGEPILFLHGFLFDGRMYEAQIAALRDRYRCVTLDFRGQGRSGHARTGYQLEQLTADVLTVIRRLDLAPTHLVGLSMGGFVGMRIGAREPGLLRSLTLLNTGASPHPPGRYPLHLALTAVARLLGPSPAPVLRGIEKELYGEPFRSEPGREADREVWRRRWATADRSSLANTMLGMMVRPDIRDELAGVSVPTLIVAGQLDVEMPPRLAREMHTLIPGSQLVELDGVGHSATLEDPARVTGILERFLAEIG
ncbi:alpha/beta hydrolase [Rhodococcus sp. CSLK01-03]|uniref:Alpha/beta hydrolase n=1 Tax=Rhodococcus indonesiensis TaxID=3055869 RepID=A0ABT7RVM8_9NOCA|nr:alpha/beta hydrolase [Rhodococcus indonesiensis]MDM7491703.1 alpha/beta hydrolase [Rhodococcus indonesiensis]